MIIHIATAMTFGLIYPWLFIDSVRTWIREVIFSGHRAEFDGEVLDYCQSVCLLNCLASILTCGLWNCCGCAQRRKSEWLDNHLRLIQTVPINTPLHHQHHQRFYFFQAHPSCFYRMIIAIVSAISCGICYPWLVIAQLKSTIQEFNFGGLHAKFIGEPCEFCQEVICINCVLNFITCGLYLCCGCAETRRNRWIDDHIVPDDESLPFQHPSSYPPQIQTYHFSEQPQQFQQQQQQQQRQLDNTQSIVDYSQLPRQIQLDYTPTAPPSNEN